MGMSIGQNYHLQEDKLTSLDEVSPKGLRMKQAEKIDFYNCQERFETQLRGGMKLLLPLTSGVVDLET